MWFRLTESDVLARPQVAAVLESLCRKDASGVLEVDGNPAGAIYLDQGRITFARSSWVPELAARLGGALRPSPELRDLLHDSDQADRNSGALLVRRGYLSENDLRSILRSTVIDALIALTMPLAGGSSVLDIRFEAPGAHWAAAFLRLSLDSVQPDVTRRATQMTHAGVALDAPIVLRDLDRPSAILTQTQWAIASRVNGARSPRDLARQTGLSLYETVTSLGALVRRGLCVPTALAPFAATPSAPVSAVSAVPPASVRTTPVSADTLSRLVSRAATPGQRHRTGPLAPGPAEGHPPEVAHVAAGSVLSGTARDPAPAYTAPDLSPAGDAPDRPAARTPVPPWPEARPTPAHARPPAPGPEDRSAPANTRTPAPWPQARPAPQVPAAAAAAAAAAADAAAAVPPSRSAPDGISPGWPPADVPADARAPVPAWSEARPAPAEPATATAAIAAVPPARPASAGSTAVVSDRLTPPVDGAPVAVPRAGAVPPAPASYPAYRPSPRNQRPPSEPLVPPAPSAGPGPDCYVQRAVPARAGTAGAHAAREPRGAHRAAPDTRTQPARTQPARADPQATWDEEHEVPANLPPPRRPRLPQRQPGRLVSGPQSVTQPLPEIGSGWSQPAQFTSPSEQFGAPGSTRSRPPGMPPVKSTARPPMPPAGSGRPGGEAEPGDFAPAAPDLLRRVLEGLRRLG